MERYGSCRHTLAFWSLSNKIPRIEKGNKIEMKHSLFKRCQTMPLDTPPTYDQAGSASLSMFDTSTYTLNSS